MSEANNNPVLNFLKQFISFESFITPRIIVFIFWISVIGLCLTSLITIFYGYVIYGIVKMVLGVIFTKVFCETLIVLFRINSNLKKIAENTKK